MVMVSSPRKLLFEALSHGLPLKILRKGSDSLGAYQGKEEGVRNERRGELFIEKVRHQLSDRATDIRQPYRTSDGLCTSV
jgi:hypothetical protein